MKLPVLKAWLSFLLTAGCVGSGLASSFPVISAASAPSTSTGSAPDTTLSQQGRDPSGFPAYVAGLKNSAKKQGFDEATINAAFMNIHFVDRAIKSDRSQLEQTVTLNDYLSRVLTARKIERGREELSTWRSQLDGVAARSGVPPGVVVALWGMESQFGAVQGKEEIVSALATLAFEGRREAFFTAELMAALRIIQQQHIPAEVLKGSWAGAMGQSQFMPSAFLNYGKDGDGDGKIDIWNNVADVFASIANYLQQEGWQPGQGWGVEVTLPADFDGAQSGLKTGQAKTPEGWQQLGVKPNDPLSGTPPTRAWIVTPQDGDGRSFMVYDNFRTLMHWNRSYYFAISVGMMADALME